MALFCMIAAPKWIRGILLEGREGRNHPLERFSILFINWIDNKAILNQGNAEVCGVGFFVCLFCSGLLIFLSAVWILKYFTLMVKIMLTSLFQ